MDDALPEIIKQVGFDFNWDNKKVWQLNIPINTMNIEELIWHFDIPFHSNNDAIYNLTSWEIIKNPTLYPQEYERTMNADLNYPIDIMENKGRWVILDGLHRLMKYYIQEDLTIKVRIIPRDKISEILSDQ